MPVTDLSSRPSASQIPPMTSSCHSSIGRGVPSEAALAPAWMAAAELAQLGPDRGRHLVRAAAGSMGAVGQGVQPAGSVAAQPAVNGLAADAVALGDLDHREPVAQDSMTALKRCSATVSSRSTLLTSSPRRWSAKQRKDGGHVNHQPEPWNPTAGINRSSINPISTKTSVSRFASNLPATKPRIATACTASLHCGLCAEQD
jgi:hypothetical protein